MAKDPNGGFKPWPELCDPLNKSNDAPAQGGNSWPTAFTTTKPAAGQKIITNPTADKTINSVLIINRLSMWDKDLYITTEKTTG